MPIKARGERGRAVWQLEPYCKLELAVPKFVLSMLGSDDSLPATDKYRE
jgi:hypothetical protein